MNLKEIAAISNVSITTVSMVLNNKDGINSETRKRIAELLVQNGYIIKDKAPKNTSQGVILFVRYQGTGRLMELHDDFYMKILNGIEEECRVLNYTLSIVNADFNTLNSVIANAYEQEVSGILFFASEFDPQNAYMLNDINIPFVSIDSNFTQNAMNSIEVDNILSTKNVVEYLYNLGHRRIGYIQSTQTTGSLPERQIGFFRALEQKGLTMQKNHHIKLEMFSEKAYSQMLTYLKTSQSLPTAFFADNDALAIGAMRALIESGYNVPNDISIVGFDDSYACTITSPQLTTVHTSSKKMGILAVRRLNDIIKNDDKDIVVSRLITKLIVRQTTGRVPE